MLEHNPILAQQHNPAERMAAEKQVDVNNPALRQTGTDVVNKEVSPLREFPADSAFISDEARKAFEKRDEQQRIEDEYDRMASQWEKDALKKQKRQKKRRKQPKNPYLRAYKKAQDMEK